MLRTDLRAARECRLRRLGQAALTQVSIDVAAVKDALARFPADAAAAATGSGPMPVRFCADVFFHPQLTVDVAQWYMHLQHKSQQLSHDSSWMFSSACLPALQCLVKRLTGVMQAAIARLAAEHRAAVEERVAPIATLLKVLQIADDRAFVTSYQQLLEARYQSSAQMAALLNIVDLSKDAATARLNLLRYRSGSTPRATVRHACCLWKPKQSLSPALCTFNADLCKQFSRTKCCVAEQEANTCVMRVQAAGGHTLQHVAQTGTAQTLANAVRSAVMSGKRMYTCQSSSAAPACTLWPHLSLFWRRAQPPCTHFLTCCSFSTLQCSLQCDGELKTRLPTGVQR